MSTYTQKSLNFQLFKTKLSDMGNLTEKYKQAICMFPAVDPSLMIGLFQRSVSTAEIQTVSRAMERYQCFKRKPL